MSAGTTRHQPWTGECVGGPSSWRVVPIDLACVDVQRDREQLTAILGSAIALRLFLFMVPTVAMSVAMIRLVAGPGGLDALLRQSSITGGLAQEVNRSTDTSTSTLVLAVVASAWIAAWAGPDAVPGNGALVRSSDK